MSKDNNGAFTPAEWQSATKQALELGRRAAAAAERTQADKQATSSSQNGVGNTGNK